MDITRQQAIEISREIEAAIKPILAKHGLTLNSPKTTYGERYDYKITASRLVASDTGVNMASPEAKAFLRNANMHGITDAAKCFDQTIRINGKTYMLIGYKPRATKRPFILKDCADGKTYVFPNTSAKFFPTYDKETDYYALTGVFN